MTDAAVLVSTQNGVHRLSFNRPSKANAFNREVSAILVEELDRCAQDDSIRAVILTGEGGAFCSGQDLSDASAIGGGGPLDLGKTLVETYNPVLTRMRALQKPIIGAVNGVAAGAGANLALTCDIVLAAESAQFIQAFVKIGLMPDVGGSWMLPRLIGEARAKALAMTAEPVDAKTAESWGMIWKAVADDQLHAEATALAERLAKGATVAMGLAKLAIQESAGAGYEEHLMAEAEYQRQAGLTPDFVEGVSAFLQKRAPNFKGVR